jgi:transposase
MMGMQRQQKDLFSYQIDLDRRVRADHPLRRIAGAIDFTFARAEVAHTYGQNGNVSIDPAVILKMMFLLFLDDIASERQLMQIIPERLDYLWFLGYGLEEEVPHHSVLSKARARWGSEIFEKLFVRTVGACVAAGLVEGKKIHMDGSLIAANASTDSIISGPPELITAFKAVYLEQEAKLEERAATGGPVNQTHVSTSDPDAQLARQKSQPSRPSYKHHRVVDNACGVITAHQTTGGAVRENTQLMPLIGQHQTNTATAVTTVVADSQYGTVENFLNCQERGIRTHMADVKATQARAGQRGEFFTDDQFVYHAATDTYCCPAGETLRRRQRRPEKKAWQYMASAGVCAGCALRSQCTAAKHGRRIQRFERQQELDKARAQSKSMAGRRDRKRRRHLMEGSFADAANQHGFKRARWRGLWRQHIQNHLIAACQNVRVLLKHPRQRPAAVACTAIESLNGLIHWNIGQWTQGAIGTFIHCSPLHQQYGPHPNQPIWATRPELPGYSQMSLRDN